jgi:putative DNA primase/helicase
MVEIATAERGAGREEASGDWRFGGNDGLVIHHNGYWHDFVAGKGGHGALSLFAHLRGDEQAVARAWLAQHAGDGRLGRSDGSEEDEFAQSLIEAQAEAFIDSLWFRAQPVTDSSQAMKYFAGRSLDPVAVGADAQMRWLPDWRGDEGVIVTAVTSLVGELAALQFLHITPDGEKSKVQPVRKTLKGPHDWRRRGAFRLGSAGVVSLVIVEGIEDAIAAAMAGAERVHACLGASGIGRAELPLTVTRVVLARDDDPPGSPASLQLGRGAARVMLQGREVKITPRAGLLAEGAKDIADLLKTDVALASQLLSEAGGLKVMLDTVEKEAFLDEVSRAPTDAYENTRKAIADALGWRVAALDRDRSERRAKHDDDPVTRVTEIEPWPDPVTDLGPVLDGAVGQLKRFLVVPDSTYLDTAALWAAHTHVVHRAELDVGYTPRITFQSPIRRCGKSTGLKCVHLMAHNPRTASSISPSSLFRAVDAFAISLMVDEGDNVFKNANPELLAILNSGADRMTAKVMRTEKADDGKLEPREFNCFAPVGFTSIKQLPETLQDRSIVLQMRRAKKGERPERLTLRTRGPLIDIGRQLTRWAADLKGLPDPDIPADLFNRVEDRWFILFQIAALAGGDWTERCRKAALADLAREEANDADGGLEGDLLADVWEVFHAGGKVRISTKDICADLIALSEAPWTTANHGQPVNEYYLKAHLRDFLPDNAEDIAPRRWREGAIKARGFHQLHLEDAFGRYLGKGLPCPPAQQKPAAPDSEREEPSSREAVKDPAHPAHPAQKDNSALSSNGYRGPDASNRSGPPSGPEGEADHRAGHGPDGGPDAGRTFGPENRNQNQRPSGNGPDGPDGPDILTPLRERDAPNSPDDGGLSAQPKPNGDEGASPADFHFPRTGRGRGAPKKGAAQ